MKKKILMGLGALIVTGALLVVALQLAAPIGLPAADVQTFATANRLYEKGQYAAAANLYRQLIAEGVENADVYYNLGRTYAALGDQGKAGDMYAQARVLNPRDAQIAQAAGTTGGLNLPLTENERALGILIALCGVAGVVTIARRRERSSPVPA